MKPMSEETLHEREDIVAIHREAAKGCGCDAPWCRFMEQGNDEVFRLRRVNARLERHLKFRDEDSRLLHSQADRLEKRIKDLGAEPHPEKEDL